MELEYYRITMTEVSLKAVLSQEILREYFRLMEVVTPSPVAARIQKRVAGSGENVSISDLIAYQIGWGKCLIRWYEVGIRQEASQMPGEGFSNWDYKSIAHHFYQKYQYDSFQEQENVFHQVVTRILEIVEEEFKKGRLDKLGVWSWCTLRCGKKWPLSKWVKANTSSPYKRATLMIKRSYKHKP
jgi:hypothetical protein